MKAVRVDAFSQGPERIRIEQVPCRVRQRVKVFNERVCSGNRDLTVSPESDTFKRRGTSVVRNRLQKEGKPPLPFPRNCIIHQGTL